MTQYILLATDRKGALRDLAACLSLAAIGLFALWPIGGNGFIAHFDDGAYLVANPEVARGLTWSGVRWAFTTFHASNWHPVTWISHMVDLSLFGWDAGAHHRVGLAIHVVNGLLLYALFRRLTARIWPSAFAAALFLVHPLHVESVAWASERKDLLCAFFVLLSSHAYVSWVRRPTGGRYLSILLLFALALLSKPMAVTWPFVLLLLDFWPLSRLAPGHSGAEGKSLPRRLAPLFVEKVPLLLLSAASCAVTLVAQSAGGAIVSAELNPLWFRALNAVLSCGRYLWMTVFPVGLCVFYPHPGISGVPLSLSRTALAAVVLAGSGLAAWRMRHTSPWFTVGWYWYLGMLVPVIGLVQVGGQAMADRYTYLPLVGPFVALVWEIARRTEGRPAAARAAAGAGIAILVLLAILSRGQASLWKDYASLFGHALEVSGNNWNAHNIMGIELARRGDLDAARGHLEEAVRINPASDSSRYNLASVLHRQGRDREAMTHLIASIQARPDNPEAIRLIDRISGRTDDPDLEIAYLEEVVKRRPGDPDAWNELGAALGEVGRRVEAIDRYRQALRIDPNHPVAHFNMALDLEAEGDRVGAVLHYREALRLRPDDAEAAARLKALAGG